MVASTAGAQQQETVVLDLAQQPAGGTTELSVSPGSYQIRIVNRMPTAAYTTRLRLETIPMPDLPVDFGERVATTRGTCDAILKTLRDDLFAATSEAQVAEFIRTHRADAATMCAPEKLAELAGIIESLTVVVVGPRELERGQQLVLDVSRTQDATTLTWSLTLSPGARGAWLTVYGFGFLPNQDEEFFSKSVGDKQFEITRKNDDLGGLSYVPSIFFTWMPRKWENSAWAISPTGGLGFELSDPVVFAGASVSYNTNLHFIIGAAIHKQKRLDGQYEAEQMISELLTTDQLTATTFKPNFFFALAFRFGSNPFKAEE